MTATATAQLNESLVGTWKLVSYTATYNNNKSEVNEPAGAHPSGFLTYTADGRVSVIMGNSDRKPFTKYPPSAEEWAAAAQTFNAYAGSYTFTGDKVTHHIEVSLFQDLVETDQVRSVKIEGDRLTLRGSIVVKGGVTVANGEVVWERVKP